MTQDRDHIGTVAMGDSGVTEEMINAALNACPLSYFQPRGDGNGYVRCSANTDDIRLMLTAALSSRPAQEAVEAKPFMYGIMEPTSPATLTGAASDVVAERQRQISVENWSPEHDDEHLNGELRKAATCYIASAVDYLLDVPPPLWPWSQEWWKPTGGRRDLIKAAALILAEIERLDRASAEVEG